MTRSGALRSGLLLLVPSLSCAPPPTPLEAPPPRLPVDHAARHPGADAVVLSELHDVELRFDPNGDVFSIQTTKVRKKLLRNLSEHAELELVVHAGDELTDLRARTRRNSGEIIELRPEDVRRERGRWSGSDSFAGFETVWFAFPGIEPGCEIEYEARVRVGKEYHRGRWLIQDTIPKERTEFRMAIPRNLLSLHGWTWRFEEYNAPFLGMPERLDRDIAEEAGTRHKTVFRWIAHDVPAFEPEDRMPPPRRYLARVDVAPGLWSTWADPARAYRRDFFEPAIREDRRRTAKLAEKLTAEAEDDGARIRRLRDYVRGIRDVAVSLEEGDLRPTPPMRVVERAYGDGEDKAALLVALLKAVDIPAFPVLLRTSPTGRIDPDFVSFDFDRVIVRVEPEGGDAVWIDPASRFCPLGRLPWQDQGVDALVVHDDGGWLERTPLDAAEDNRIDATVYLSVDPGGDGRGRARWVLHGMDAISARARLHEATKKDLVRYCGGLLDPAYGNADIGSVRVAHREDLEEALEIEFEFEISGVVRQQGALGFVRPEVLRIFDWIPADLARDRRYPVEFRYPRAGSLEVVVEVPPESWRPHTLPEDLRAAGAGMEFQRRCWDRTERHVVFQTTARLAATHVEIAEWPATHAFLERVKVARAEDIILAGAR